MSYLQRPKQDSVWTQQIEFSPRINRGSEDQYKQGTQINFLSKQIDLPSISSKNSKCQQQNVEENTNFGNQSNRKKKFYLAKKLNQEVINDMINNNEQGNNQQLQVVNNANHQKKPSHHLSPLTSPRNSDKVIYEQPKEDLILQLDVHEDQLSQKNIQCQDITAALPLSKKVSIASKCQENTLPQISQREIKKSYSQNNTLQASPDNSKQNIFNTKTLSIEQKGPRYDEIGNIISRSLVGKPDWFQKKDGQFLDQERLKEIGGNKKNSQIKKQNSFSTLSKQKSDNKSKIKNRNLTNKMTKRQLLDQIDVIKQRISFNQKQEELDIQQLQIDQKMQQTRDIRIMQKHEDNEQFWQKFIEKTSDQLNRDFSYSQLIRSDYYKNMREATEVFSICKSDLERYGSKLWEMTLRKRQSRKLNLYNDLDKQEPADLIITQDLPQAFQCSSLTGERKVLQFSRKPLITDPVANILNNSNTFQSTHQRLLQLKNISETLHNNNLNNQNSSILQQNFGSMIEDQSIIEADNHNTSNINDTASVPIQNENRTKNLVENYQEQSQKGSPYNQHTPNHMSHQLAKSQSQNISNINVQTKSNSNVQSIMKNNNSQLQMKKSHTPFKSASLNQSNISFMNSTFQVAQSLQQPFQSFRASKYYEERLESIQDLVKDYKTIYQQNADLQGLAVIGESQLEREIEMVKKADEYALFYKFKQQEDENYKEDDLF
ncbi:hypothetical protein TTHERM_00130010 (macronuclear) [Tetrahymena thermophila SB210]|uniref:Uncharacterized protein n=1 Tax=Tetrahymena thermophila (strain SB210) TaxID=312017 RepID=I7MJE0_TETTS|nr:hypothetical protein TTHERM_00130010 [Tetrahymena thermophila SB210]EAR96224.1 hypothetical protein TTHERM_00130010 [Tetrahymena thermophila SB210]|eukprot:XP_001016469.1 hypothetical protein TTHERM_00130010 [Tetrahymena thermophila SB210]